jgi:hypothetical protein
MFSLEADGDAGVAAHSRHKIGLQIGLDDLRPQFTPKAASSQHGLSSLYQ